MLNQFSEIAPTGAIAALAVWGGLSYFVTGPEVATRIARADHMPACEAMLRDSIASTFETALAEVSRPTEVERQGAASSAYLGGMNRQYPEHMQFLDMLSGGGWSQSMGALDSAAKKARQARAQAERAIKERREAALDSAPDQCSCQVTAAIADHQQDWALFAGTLGLVEQDGVSEFPAMMRSNARRCAERSQT